MKIKITAAGNFGVDGEIAIGTVMDVKEEPNGWAGRYEVIEAGAIDEPKLVTNPAKIEKVTPADAIAPFEAKHKGGGYYAIMDSQNREVGETFKKEEADKFNALSDEDKASHVAGLTE
jgi:hypothetical protein